MINYNDSFLNKIFRSFLETTRTERKESYKKQKSHILLNSSLNNNELNLHLFASRRVLIACALVPLSLQHPLTTR